MTKALRALLGAFGGFCLAILIEAFTGLRGDLPTLGLIALTVYGGIWNVRRYDKSAAQSSEP